MSFRPVNRGQFNSSDKKVNPILQSPKQKEIKKIDRGWGGFSKEKWRLDNIEHRRRLAEKRKKDLDLRNKKWAEVIKLAKEHKSLLSDKGFKEVMSKKGNPDFIKELILKGVKYDNTQKVLEKRRVQNQKNLIHSLINQKFNGIVPKLSGIKTKPLKKVFNNVSQIEQSNTHINSLTMSQFGSNTKVSMNNKIKISIFEQIIKTFQNWLFPKKGGK